MARAHPLQPGGCHGDPLPIDSPNGGGRQTAPPERCRPLCGLQPLRVVRLLPKIRFQSIIFSSCSHFQCWNNCCKAILLVDRLPLQTERREESQQPLHYKRRAQLPAGDVRRRIAYCQAAFRLGQRRIEILQLHPHLLHAAGGQLNAAQGQCLPVCLVQKSAGLPRCGYHMVIRSQ